MLFPPRRALNATVAGGAVTLKAAGSSAKVVVPDVALGNGGAVVHVIDYVLVPSNVVLRVPQPSHRRPPPRRA